MEGGNPQQSPQQGAPPNRQQNPYARYPQGQQGQQMGHPQYAGMAPHGQQAPPHSGRPGPQTGAPYGTSPGTAYPAGYVPGTPFQPQMGYGGQQGYYYPPQQMAGYVYMPPGTYPQAATAGQAARPPPKRERKAIAIIDPTTNEEVKIEGAEKKERTVSVSEEAEKKADEPKKKEDEEKKKKDEEEKKKHEEEERKEEEEERLRKEKEAEESKKKEEEERLRVEEEEKTKKEEEERLQKEEEERKKKEEEEAKLKQEEEELKKKEEEEKTKAEDEKAKKEVEEKAKQEEEDKKKREEEEKVRKEREVEETKRKDEELRKQLDELEDGEIVDTADEPPRKKRAINVQYPADCWAPTNTSGKKWYPIDLLMQFKDVCHTAPADAVLPQDLLPGGRPPSTSSRGGASSSRGGRPNPRAPSQDGRGGDYGQMVYQQPPGGRGPVQRQQSGGMNRGGSRQGGGRGGAREGSRDGRRQQQGNQPILPDENIEPIPQSGENAWKPRTAVDVNNLDEEKRQEVEDENLFRKMKALLNKLTLDKFEKLCGQIMALEINTPRRMEGCIVLVFDKALDEPGFASMYADLCKRLSTLEVKVPETPGQTDAEKKKKEYNFRRLLLNKCQVEFEKERDIPPRQEGVAAEDEDIKVVRARLRMFGNIKFIGELFKRNMLTEKIMHECVKQLLSADKRAGNDKKLPSEEAIECLTKLLSTVGKMLDRPEAKSHMDAYFHRLQELARQKAFPSRIRFLCQELIELRQTLNWIPRRADNTPKTIEEVHRQAAIDAQKAAAVSQQAQAAYQHGGGGGGYGRTNSQGGRGGGQFGGFRGGPPQQQQNPDGWNTVGNRQNTRADLQALRNARSVSSDGRQAEASPSLGPGGRLGGPGMWAAHAQQAAAKPNTLGQRATVGGAGASMAASGGFTKNSFAMLHQEEDDDHGDMGQRSRSRDNREPEQTASPALGAGWRPTLSGFKPTAPSKATPPVTPTIPKKSDSGPATTSMQAAADKEKAVGPQLSKDEFVKKLKGMVEQYASIRDITEARQDFKDMGTSSLHVLLVEKMVGDYLENKKVRPGAAELLAIYVRDGSVSKQDFYAGVDQHVEFLEDLEVDVPKIYDYVAEYVGPLVADGTLTLLDLTENLKNLETLRAMPCEGAAKFVAAVLRYVAEKQGAEKATELWKASGLNLAKFLEDGRQEDQDVKDFAASKKIDFILA